MSSLVEELRDPDSPVTRYLRETFPHHKPIQGRLPGTGRNGPATSAGRGRCRNAERGD
jgi:hypothetical protein